MKRKKTKKGEKENLKIQRIDGISSLKNVEQNSDIFASIMGLRNPSIRWAYVPLKGTTEDEPQTAKDACICLNKISN